jgi:hypothetical protein
MRFSWQVCGVLDVPRNCGNAQALLLLQSRLTRQGRLIAMSLGTWEPEPDADTPPLAREQLERFIDISRGDRLEQLETLLEGGESQRLTGLMRVDHARWAELAENLSGEELRHLIRFFAVAENLPGCEAGAQSPVIPLARALRERGEKLPRDLLQWLKQVSTNRFLPYGPL